MVGVYIKSLRSAAGMTQRQLAQSVGISPSMLSHVEAGRREPTIQLLRDIALALEIPTAALFVVALEDDSPVIHPQAKKMRSANADLLSAVHHSLVLRRLQEMRERKTHD